MGRWKLGPQGGYYDPNDSGPDQYNPTPAERASQGGGEQGGYAPPTGGVSGYGGWMNPHPGQPTGLGTLNTIAGQPQDLYGGNPPRDPEGRTIQDIFANRAGTPPAGWQYQPGDPSQATDQGPYAWGQPFGSGASTGSVPKNGLSGTVLNRIFGSVGSAPKTTGGVWGNIFGGLGSLTKSAGAAIGPYGTPR